MEVDPLEKEGRKEGRKEGKKDSMYVHMSIVYALVLIMEVRSMSDSFLGNALFCFALVWSGLLYPGLSRLIAVRCARPVCLSVCLSLPPSLPSTYVFYLWLYV